MEYFDRHYKTRLHRNIPFIFQIVPWATFFILHIITNANIFLWAMIFSITTSTIATLIWLRIETIHIERYYSRMKISLTQNRLKSDKEVK